jgi:hypothetical protein
MQQKNAVAMVMMRTVQFFFFLQNGKKVKE